MMLGKKKEAKKRMAEVNKIPSRPLLPSSSEMEMKKKKAASEVASIKPQGVKSKRVFYPGVQVEGNERYMSNVMKKQGKEIKNAAALNAIKKGPSPIERDMKKKQLMSDYKKNSAAGAKKATKKK